MAARKTIPIWEKRNLTLEEAAEYFGIGVSKIRELSNQEGCEFVLWIEYLLTCKIGDKEFQHLIKQKFIRDGYGGIV